MPTPEVGDRVSDDVVDAVRAARRGASRRRSATSKPAARSRSASSCARSSTSTIEPLRPCAQLAQRPGAHDRAAAEDHHRVADPLRPLRGDATRRRCRSPNSVPTRLISASMSSRWSGSSPSVGSSSRTSAGSWTIASASFTRCRWPVDIVPIGRNRSSPRPTCQSASFAALDRDPGGEAVQLAEVPDEIGRMHVGREIVVLRREPDPRPHPDAGCGRVVPEHGQLAGIAGAEARARAR